MAPGDGAIVSTKSELAAGLPDWQLYSTEYPHEDGALDPALPPQTLKLHAFIGEARVPNGKVIEWIPGLGSNGYVDRVLADELRSEGYDVVIAEPPGVGRSPGLKNSAGQPLRIKELGSPLIGVTLINRATAALFNAAKQIFFPGSKAVVSGHSYGGSMAAGMGSPLEYVNGKLQEKKPEHRLEDLEGAVTLTAGMRGLEAVASRAHWYISFMASDWANGYARFPRFLHRFIPGLEKAGTKFFYNLFSGNFGHRDFEALASVTALNPDQGLTDEDIKDRLFARTFIAGIAEAYLSHPGLGRIVADSQSVIPTPVTNILAMHDAIIKPRPAIEAVNQSMPKNGRSLVVRGANRKAKVGHLLPHNHPQFASRVMHRVISSGHSRNEGDLISSMGFHAMQAGLQVLAGNEFLATGGMPLLVGR